jgi:hypothetical protein
MLRFTIRDLLWLMVVVGLALALLSEHQQRITETENLRQAASQYRKESDRWHELSAAQLRAFDMEQRNVEAARVKMLEAVHQRLQEMTANDRKKAIDSLPSEFRRP